MKNAACLLTFALLISLNLSFAQKEVEVKWGPEMKLESRTRINSFIGEDEEGFYILKYNKRNYIIEKYRKNNLNIIFSNEFEMPKIGKRSLALIDIEQVDGKLLMFSSFYDKEALKTTIYVQEINDKGVLNSKYKKIEEIEYESKKDGSSWDLVLSRDKTKFLIYRNIGYDKHSNEKFSYKVYDNTFEVLFEKTFELPYRDKVVALSNVRLSNDGKVYLAAKISPDRKKGEKSIRKIQNEKYNIFAYFPDSDDLRQYQISLGTTKWISEMSYTINTEGNVLVGGFYSESDAISMDGTFFLTINKDSKEVESENLKKFSNDFLLNFMKEKHVKKGKRDLGVFDLRAPVLRDDGGIIMIAEYYRFYTTTTTDQNGNSRTTYHYLYHDLMVINVDPDGTIDWTTHIPKKQHTTNDNGIYSSYSLVVNEDKLHFIFNDNPKNIVQYEKDPKKLKPMNQPRKSIAMLSTVDSDGNMRRSPLFKAKDFKTVLMPKFYYSTDKMGEIIIYGIKGSKYKFGKIDFSNY